MKKIALILLAFLGFFSVSNAQVCKISGENDNVEVMNYYFEDETTVVVVVSNDSKDISANVTVEVSISKLKKGNAYGTYDLSLAGKGRAMPNQDTQIKIKLPSPYRQDPAASSIKVTKISGSNCL
mgnify:CR=1 FL=1